jgi:hypothetical protein
MKKVLVLLLGLMFFNTSAQKMSPAYLKGQWTSNGEGTEIAIEGTSKNKLIITEVSSYSGKEVKVLRYYMDKKNLYIETLFEPKNFVAISKFIIIDNNTMVADVVSDVPGQIIYKRLTTNKKIKNE